MKKELAGRSFGRIVWREDVLSFHMVNARSQRYAIFAEPLINIARNPNDFVRVKRMNSPYNRPEGTFHGEIYGCAEGILLEGVPFIMLGIHFGTADRTMSLAENGQEMRNVVAFHKYLFPEDEFHRFVQDMETMLIQSSDFASLKMGIGRMMF